MIIIFIKNIRSRCKKNESC